MESDRDRFSFDRFTSGPCVATLLNHLSLSMLTGGLCDHRGWTGDRNCGGTGRKIRCTTQRCRPERNAERSLTGRRGPGCRKGRIRPCDPGRQDRPQPDL